MQARFLALGLGAVAVAALALGGWWFLLRGDAPAEVSLQDAIAGLSTSTPAATPAATPTSATTPANAAPVTATATPVAAASPPESLEGTWSVDASRSFVGYRVQEQLSGLGAATAVGRTSTLEGALEFDGSTITAVEVVADLRDLRSDDSRRDGQLRTQALETNRFPEASFVLAEPIVLVAVPAEGEAITVTAQGDLTVHGVTRRIEIDLEGALIGDAVVVVGSTVIEFADYDIAAPRAPIVLSVEERAVIEFQVVFQKA
jgi:polyisoprenoid-binding protein YceI